MLSLVNLGIKDTEWYVFMLICSHEYILFVMKLSLRCNFKDLAYGFVTAKFVVTFLLLLPFVHIIIFRSVFSVYIWCVFLLIIIFGHSS